MLKVQEIREIIKLIDDSTITEFNYKTEGTTISLKKGNEAAVNMQPVNPAVTEVPTTVTKTAPAEAPKVEEKAVEEAVQAEEKKVVDSTEQAYDYEVISPMVGTFYASPSPEDDSYVTVGSKVEPQTVVCIVEAMKLFNEIEAEVSGEIVEVVANNGELVEYGQPLFRVKKK